MSWRANVATTAVTAAAASAAVDTEHAGSQLGAHVCRGHGKDVDVTAAALERKRRAPRVQECFACETRKWVWQLVFEYVI